MTQRSDGHALVTHSAISEVLYAVVQLLLVLDAHLRHLLRMPTGVSTLDRRSPKKQQPRTGMRVCMYCATRASTMPRGCQKRPIRRSVTNGPSRSASVHVPAQSAQSAARNELAPRAVGAHPSCPSVRRTSGPALSARPAAPAPRSPPSGPAAGQRRRRSGATRPAPRRSWDAARAAAPLRRTQRAADAASRCCVRARTPGRAPRRA